MYVNFMSDNRSELEKYFLFLLPSTDLLNKLIDKIPVLAGVDESPDRLKSLNNERIKTYLCRSDKLTIEDNSFEAILMSHIMHEIKLFYDLDVYSKTISEIKKRLIILKLDKYKCLGLSNK